MGLSTNGESTVLTALLTGRYLSLHKADPGNTGANEVAGGAYARQAVTFVASGGNPTNYKNNAVVQFPVATADWGTITHFGIWSASTAGTFYGSATLDIPKTVSIDDVVRFIANALTITAD